MTHSNSHITSLRALVVMLLVSVAVCAAAQRRVTPVVPREPGQGQTPVKEQPIDRSRLVTTTDAQGNTVTVDTVTGREFIDSALIQGPPPMEYPLIYQASAGVNLWDPLMRVFGQKYGLGDVWVELNMHNRYMPLFVAGVGNCNDTPANKNYTFKTGISPYFKIGASYNFLYNSNPDYKLMGGLRYGIGFTRWSVTDVTVDEGYWGTPAHYELDGINSTTGYIEVVFGIRVKLWRWLSAGWNIIYHSVLHDSSSPHGQPMYIPGYGMRKGAVTGNFSLVYTIPINKKNTPEVDKL